MFMPNARPTEISGCWNSTYSCAQVVVTASASGSLSGECRFWPLNILILARSVITVADVSKGVACGGVAGTVEGASPGPARPTNNILLLQSSESLLCIQVDDAASEKGWCYPVLASYQLILWTYCQLQVSFITYSTVQHTGKISERNCVKVVKR